MATRREVHFSRSGGLISLMVSTILATWLFLAPGTEASVITVTTTAESGPGSLRQALAQAQPGDIITFDPGLASATIFLTTDQLVIGVDVVVDGSMAPGLTVSGSHASRIFLVERGVTARITGLRIADGRTPDGKDPVMMDGGGIYNLGHLTLTYSMVVSNTTGSGVDWTGMGDRPRGGHGGGIYNAGSLWVSHSEIVSNTTGLGAVGTINPHYAGASGGSGGGIYNAGTLVVADSIVSSNRTGKGGEGAFSSGGGPPSSGGCGGAGGGILNRATAVVLNSAISGNHTGQGGGGGSADHWGPGPIFGGADGGCGGRGGGVVNFGVMTLIGNAVFANTTGGGGDGGQGESAQYGGGGAAGGDGGPAGDGAGLFSTGQLLASNCTLSANAAGAGGNGGAGGYGNGAYASGPGGNGGDGGLGGQGAGLYHGGAGTMVFSTVTGNNAGSGGVPGLGGGGTPSGLDGQAGTPGRGGGVHISGGDLMVGNTLLAGNSADFGLDCWGTLRSAGHNLLYSPDGCTLDGDLTGNLVGADPLLAPLRVNPPGATATHALRPNSPAIDAGLCGNGATLTDQRGVPRPQGAACDVGAFELRPWDWFLQFLPLITR